MERGISKVMLALDNMTDQEIREFLNAHGAPLKIVKIGMEAFYRYGPSFVAEISKQYGLEIFLDLKLHDIPNTVSKAIHSLKGLPIAFLTIHLSGGEKMIRAAQLAMHESLPKAKLLGVSVLTSLDEEDCQKIWQRNTDEVFHSLYEIALKSEIDGIVCSGFELAQAFEIERANNSQRAPIKVCPGIRFENSTKDDQSRVMTPKEAFDKGANYLVMGRAITTNPKCLTQVELFT